MQPGQIRVTTDDELKRFAEIVELGAARLPTADSTPAELDELALAPVGLLNLGSEGSWPTYMEGGTYYSLVD
jgi:hypothetical protein